MSITTDVISVMKLIESEANKIHRVNVNPAVLKRGFDISARASSQPEEVPITPWVKNAMEQMGDLTVDHPRLLVDDPETKFEAYVHTWAEKMLNKYYGPKEEKYNEDLQVSDPFNLTVDCWRNLKDNMRQIQPGMASMREKSFSEFRKPSPTKFDVYQALSNDQVFIKAIEMVYNMMPEVLASKDIVEVSLPFQNKKTNVGYPFFHRDDAIDPSTGKRYDDLTLDIAKSISNLNQLYDYNVAIGFGRNTRGKGRAVIGTSRIINLRLNQLLYKKVDRYREKFSAFAGYNDDMFLKDVLSRMHNACEAHNLKCANWDQSSYDQHVGRQWLLLASALSYLKANGSFSKELALKRGALATTSYFIDGLSHTYSQINGRIFSGFIDTNRLGGLINLIITLYTNMLINPKYSSIVYQNDYWMLVMGDDNLFLYDPSSFDKDKFTTIMANLGFEVNHVKGEYGTFFLQNRFYIANQQAKMSYPWTRVLLSTMFKENTSGLGPAGHSAATLMQLSKLRGDEVGLKILLNFILKYDKFKLHLDMSDQDFKAAIAEEDVAAKKDNNRAMSTAERLWNGDPMNSNKFDQSHTGLNYDYLSELRSYLRSLVDPSFIA